MQYRNLIIFTLLILSLISCRRYKTFDEMNADPQISTPASFINQDNGLQSISSYLSDENSAYWSSNNHQVYIYPNDWQDEGVGHTLQFNQDRAIIHAPFDSITIDTIQFDETNPWPEVLLKTYNAETKQYTLEVYQLLNNYPNLLFTITTAGEIDYNVNPQTPSLSSIAITSTIQNRIEVDYYQYQPSSKQFNLTHSESQNAVQSTSRTDIESFLAGSWVSVDAEEQAMVLFEPEKKEIIFQHERVEIYKWENTQVNGIRISIIAKNEQVYQVSGNTVVTIIDNNSIALSSVAASAWSGIYTRLNVQQEQVNSQGALPLAWQESPFQGSYINQQGDEIVFDYPLFTKKLSNGSTQQGSMTLFSLNNKDIMQLRYRNNYGIIEEQESYELTFKEENDGLHYLRLLQLKPTRLFIFGSYPLPQSIVSQFEQIERIK